MRCRRCIICDPQEPEVEGRPGFVSYKSSTGTRGLTLHFNKHPGLLHAWMSSLAAEKGKEEEKYLDRKRKAAGIGKYLTKKPIYDDSHPKQEEFDRCFILWLAKSYAPLLSIEDPWFRQMIRCLDPQIKFRNRRQLRQTMLPAFVKTSDDAVLESLAQAVAVAVCFDLWMSRGAQVTYHT